MATKQEPPQFNERQRRRRLVIDFHKPGALDALPRERARLWPKLLAALGIVFVLAAVLVAGSVYFWWQHYKTLPAYSLALLIDASQRNDVATVDQIVDTDKIVDNLAGPISQKMAARYGALSPSIHKRIDALEPGLLPSVKQSVRDAVAKQMQEISRTSEPKPFVVLAIGLPYYVSINTEGDSAKVTAPAQDRQIELTLTRNRDRWKVVALKDDAVVQRIVDEIIKEFPAIGQFR